MKRNNPIEEKLAKLEKLLSDALGILEDETTDRVCHNCLWYNSEGTKCDNSLSIHHDKTMSPNDSCFHCELRVV